MSPQDFAYWLQGFLEMSGAKSLDEKQTQMLREHLHLVFTKVTAPAEPHGIVAKGSTPDFRGIAGLGWSTDARLC